MGQICSTKKVKELIEQMWECISKGLNLIKHFSNFQKRIKITHFMAHEGNTFFPVKWRKTVAKGKKIGKIRYFIKTIQRYVKQL